MIDPDKRLHDVNTAWGRGYVWGILAPRGNPPCAPGTLGGQWEAGYRHAKLEVVVHGAVDAREPA